MIINKFTFETLLETKFLYISWFITLPGIRNSRMVTVFVLKIKKRFLGKEKLLINNFSSLKTMDSRSRIYIMERNLSYDQWKIFSENYKPNKSLVVFCWQNQCFGKPHNVLEILKLKEIPYTPWKNKYSKKRTSCHNKKCFLWTKLPSLEISQ